MTLPNYTIEELKTFDNLKLIKTMINDEDRVSRLMIDECVQRNKHILEELSNVIKHNHPAETDGEWWLKLHHIMILGLISSELADKQLIECIDTMRNDDDENLQEWFSSYWPALTKNRSTEFIKQILNRCNDKTMPWFLRTNLTDIIIAHALKTGKTQLEEALDWLASMITNEEEDWDFRLTTANSLLDFPRERHQLLLNTIESQQVGTLGKHFDQKDINNAYRKNSDSPSWERFSNPWDFYEPNNIKSRQKRWQKENEYENQPIKHTESTDKQLTNDLYGFEPERYQRNEPKIGRNDPCPCGSGKKYKKCCLH